MENSGHEFRQTCQYASSVGIRLRFEANRCLYRGGGIGKTVVVTAGPQTFILDGGAGCGPDVRGAALVSTDNFGVRYDLNPETGVISNRQHDLFGHSVSGRVLVFANPKGGVAASWALASLVEQGIAPLAIIFRDANPIFVQGSIFAGLSIIHRLEPDPCTTIRTGDYCELFPSQGRVVVSR